MRARDEGPRRGPFAAFFAFGALWGAWAVLIPVVQSAVGASKGTLGLALLCVGLGSLPAMVLVGPRIDRAPWILPAATVALAACALSPAFVSSVRALAGVLLAFGAASGILDVAINAEVAAIEEATGRRSMQLAHALSPAACSWARSARAPRGSSAPAGCPCSRERACCCSALRS